MEIQPCKRFKSLVFELKTPPRVFDQYRDRNKHKKEAAKFLNGNKRAIAKVNKAARSLYISELRELKCRK